MSEKRKTQITSRKQPKQARATELVESIIEAAVDVLIKEGGQRFTTARVAERAGISVGSLYQYFPNKASILFHLQSKEWQQTTNVIQSILEDINQPAMDRLRKLVHAFVASECEEAQLRLALGDVAPLYRDAPEFEAAREKGHQIIQTFMLEILPKVSESTRLMITILITSTLSAAGEQFSEEPRTSEEVEKYSEAMADMFCLYLKSFD